MELEDAINAVNQRLKTDKVRARLELKGRKLCLRATLPVKGGAPKEQRQQRIYLDLPPEKESLNRAEMYARQLHEELKDYSFRWENWVTQTESEEKEDSVSKLITRFEKYYWEGRSRTKQAEYTWTGDYYLYFQRLIQDKPLTLAAIRAALKTYEENTRSRDRAYMRYKSLAKFAGFDLLEYERQLKPLKGYYRIGGEKGIIRDLPDDQAIRTRYLLINNKVMKWVFGALAVWGLRPHELWLIEPESLDPSNDGFITILPNLNGVHGKGKSNRPRAVPPLQPEWFHEWELWKVSRPSSSLKVGRNLGMLISQKFRRHGIPYPPYTLRHAWAVRAMYRGIDIAYAAHAMGHSTQVHERTYLYWINEHQTRAQLKKLLTDTKHLES